MENGADDRPVEDDAGRDEREDDQKEFARAEAALRNGAEQQREPRGDAEDAGETGDRLGGGRPPRLFGRRVAVEEGRTTGARAEGSPIRALLDQPLDCQKRERQPDRDGDDREMQPRNEEGTEGERDGADR